MKTLLYLLLVLCTLSAGSILADAQAIGKVSSDEPIPRDAFKTWSLFLVCNPRWLAPDMSQNLANLHQAFRAFGDTIGPDNLAVWFWKHPYQPSTTFDDLDLARSSKFCRAFQLLPSKGPYVFVTSTYPDESHLPDQLPPNSAWFELGAMQPPAISDLLAHLADELVTNRPPQQASTPPGSSVAAPVPWEIRLMEAVQHTLNTFGCAWTFEVKSEVVDAHLNVCGKG